MPLLLSWSDFLTKVLLLLMCMVCAWFCGQKYFKQRNLMPIFLMAFLPYFIVYKVVFAIGRASLLNDLYTLMLVVSTIVLAILSVIRIASRQRFFGSIRHLLVEHQIFFALLTVSFVFFILRGLFLEYPGDAIVYFQRVGQANQDLPRSLESLWHYDANYTFSSSFQRWLTGADYWMRAKAGVIAALNVCLLMTATYRLALWSIYRKSLAIASVILFLGFYGNLQISFTLYKILQGATLAMVLYMEALPALYRIFANVDTDKDRLNGRLPAVLTIIGVTIICLDCHQEKVLYVFTVALACAWLSVIKITSQQQRPANSLVFTALFLLTPLVVLFFWSKPAVSGYAPLTQEWFSIGNIQILTYWPIEANSGLVLLDVIVMGLAIILLSSYKHNAKEFFLAAVAIAPFLLFLNPIAMTGLVKLTTPDGIYRVMTAGLPWIFLPFACHVIERDTSIRLNYLPVIFVLCGFLSYAPIYGKFPHILRQVPPYADGRDLMPVVGHLLEQAKASDVEQMNILAPPYAGSYLRAWPELSLTSNRWHDNVMYESRVELAHLYSSEITDPEITRILTDRNYSVLVIDRRDGLTYSSWLARMTLHWSPNLLESQQALLAGHSLRRYLQQDPPLPFVKTFAKNGFEVYQKTEVGDT